MSMAAEPILVEKPKESNIHAMTLKPSMA